jgi:hypothetical protein
VCVFKRRFYIWSRILMIIFVIYFRGLENNQLISLPAGLFDKNTHLVQM